MRAVEVPVDNENLHKERVPLGDGRLRPAVIRRPASAGQPQKSYSPRKCRPSSPGRRGSLEEPRPAVETRRGHDLRSNESNTKRGRRGRPRLGRCGGAARRWNTPARPRSRSGGARLPTGELDVRHNARTYRPKYAGVDRHCDSEDHSQCGIGLRARESESARQPQDAGSCSRKHTFGRTRSRKSITCNPFHLSSIFRTPQTSRSVAQDDRIWKICCINSCGSCTARLLCSTCRSGQEGREKCWKEMKREKPEADCGRHSDLEDPWRHRLRSCTARLLCESCIARRVSTGTRQTREATE